MCRFPFVVVLLLVVFPSLAHAGFLRVDVTYSDGRIITGPLTGDLDALPATVHAWFLLNAAGAGDFGGAEVVASSLVFGDGAWSLGDLERFAATLGATPTGGLGVTSLTYAYGPINTAAARDRITANFPLRVDGIDVATGQAFHYQYDTSTQTVTAVPEPASALMLISGLGFAFLAGKCRRKSNFTRD